MNTVEYASVAGQMEQMLRGYFVAQALFVAARLGIADLLAQGERTAGALAGATGVDADALHRMLRALASEGIFEEIPAAGGTGETGRGESRFGLTPLGHLLRSDVEGSMRPAALIAGETQYKVWAVFKDAIKHGSGNAEAPGSGRATGFERIFRKPLFEFLAEHPDIYSVFNAAMSQRVRLMREALLEVCTLRAGETAVDIGGGLGSVIAALLEKYPHARGILFDTRRVIDQAKEILQSSPVAARLAFVAGDFLLDAKNPANADSSPAGDKPGAAVPHGDVMILASVLHMVQDATALHILKNCRLSLAAGGRLYVVETLLRPPNEPDAAKWQDLNMMLMVGGRERTFDEYANLLRQAGFSQVERRAEIVVARRS